MTSWIIPVVTLLAAGLFVLRPPLHWIPLIVAGAVTWAIFSWERFYTAWARLILGDEEWLMRKLPPDEAGFAETLWASVRRVHAVDVRAGGTRGDSRAPRIRRELIKLQQLRPPTPEWAALAAEVREFYDWLLTSNATSSAESNYDVEDRYERWTTVLEHMEAVRRDRLVPAGSRHD